MKKTLRALMFTFQILCLPAFADDESTVCATPIRESTHAGYRVTFTPSSRARNLYVAELFRKNVAGDVLLDAYWCPALQTDAFIMDGRGATHRCSVPTDRRYAAQDSGFVIEWTAADIEGIRYANVYEISLDGQAKIAELPCQ